MTLMEEKLHIIHDLVKQHKDYDEESRGLVFKGLQLGLYPSGDYLDVVFDNCEMCITYDDTHDYTYLICHQIMDDLKEELRKQEREEETVLTVTMKKGKVVKVLQDGKEIDTDFYEKTFRASTTV